MSLYADPPKHLDSWLTHMLSAEVNILRFLNGITTEDAFGMVVSSDAFLEALHIETDEWQTPPYWAYVKLCIINNIEHKPAEIGYPFPHRERVWILMFFIINSYRTTGIKPDFLFEKMKQSGIFGDYAIGGKPSSDKAKEYALKAEMAYKKMPKDPFN